ncbi:hypothetical protein MLD38_029552 [Melastoma candidum]|uniref:Uncharacterized protein n=1 Tax=Melastoma candidum TaxID=119954 RepID=A0ACB9N5X5_9MYRT|nr:hypothetical protein MLD38_029552 [Melastoma candidum]
MIHTHMLFPRRYVLTPFSSSLDGLLSSWILGNGGLGAGFCTDTGSCSVDDSGGIETSACKTFHSRKFRILGSMIPSSSWTVLKVLKDSGFRSYLVGGCVRDLILHRVPKDFDVVTTATLDEIKEKFHCCRIIGRRFPICRVQIRNSFVEVSSFETVARNTENREEFLSANMPALRDRENVILWRNSMSRDFTVNSLFFDPFARKILDFSNGVEDLRSSMLRTLLPAELSFKVDCAIILRGLRIAARLRFRLSKDIENIIGSFLPAVTSLRKGRLMMELDYMLSYGAALPSLLMLKRYGLLEVLLPFQVAYIQDNAMERPAQSSSLLVKLISKLDKLVSCDRPCHCTLWVSLLVFHLALVNHPQDALVIWAIGSVLYYGQWKEGVHFALGHAHRPIAFVPEIMGLSRFGNDELAERVSKVASLAQEYVAVLSDVDSMLKYPNVPSSGVVIIPWKVARDVGEIFRPLASDVESFKSKREGFEIDYQFLKRGFLSETRFALGKIILDTMSDAALQGEGKTGIV